MVEVVRGGKEMIKVLRILCEIFGNEEQYFVGEAEERHCRVML